MPAKCLCVGSNNSLGIGFQTDECTHTQLISTDKEMETEESDQTKAKKKEYKFSFKVCQEIL